MAGSGRLAVCLVASFGLALACGGQSLRQTGDEQGGGGTTGGTGRTSGGAGAASGGCAGARCPSGCIAGGRSYEHGESFTFDDNGCGTCTCNDGEVACVTMPCPGGRCALLPSLYQTHERFEGRACSTVIDLVQCDVLVPSQLPCGCPTFVNRDSTLIDLLAEWQALACGNDIVCEPCPAPIAGGCSVEALCFDIY